MDDAKITVRLPGAVAARLRIVAALHDRSLNSEIVHVLREHIARTERAVARQREDHHV